MAARITQRELRNNSGGILRALEEGQSFVVTRNGAPVGELTPVRRRQFVPRHLVRSALASAPALDLGRLRADLAERADDDPEPRF